MGSRDGDRWDHVVLIVFENPFIDFKTLFVFGVSNCAATSFLDKRIYDFSKD